ncbi:Uma2 family endonuclease [Streptomyces sp. WAC04770]|nr:Uma2 family endonuclease [Streptomyces sp. WAC04770]RST16322.1 Uma2 family endonuclease [Streptomyces sp. WAC04770]
MPTAPTGPASGIGPGSLRDSADRISARLPDSRFEIIDGTITATPLLNGPHADTLTTLTLALGAAGLHGKETRVLQGIGLRLPGGPEDYAIPDLAVVDADYRDHPAENATYDPACFRLVAEVTSGNHRNDLRHKVSAYAQAKIPVYVIVDRKHGRVHVLTEPLPGGYDRHEVYAPGQEASLPASLGAEVALDVDEIVRAGRPKR